MSKLDQLREGGVVGGGGAGFPLWKKLAGKAEYLLINGAECEPLLKSDQFLMLKNPDELVKSASALAEIVEAKEAVICVKDHYAAQISALKAAIAMLPVNPPVRIHELPTIYPIGDEQAVVRSATGRTVPPGGLPGEVGCCVTSVSTALNALRALDGKPVTRRYVTVAGEVKNPGVYKVPIGMPINTLLERAGGATVPEYKLILGGPMMGPQVNAENGNVVTKTTGGLLVVPADHPLIRRGELTMAQIKNRARSACIQCRTCTDLCPRYLSGHPIYPHLSMRALAYGDYVEKSAALCMECGVCELYACPMGLSPRRVQQQMKGQLRAQGVRNTFELKDAPALADLHHVPSSRMLNRIDLGQYDMPVPDTAVDVNTDLVCIPLRQHIGAPAQCVVRVGDHVTRGQVIGKMADAALGADVHASICGTVRQADENMVTIHAD